MKTLGSTGLKLLKIIHLLFAIMWVGGALCLLLVAFCVSPESGPYTHSLVLKIIDDFVIIPGAIGSLLVGVIYGIWTKWGFFRHVWLIVKWVMTVAQILFGTFVLGPFINANVIITSELGVQAISNPTYLNNIASSKLWGSVQFAGLIIFIIISVLKPWKKNLRS